MANPIVRIEPDRLVVEPGGQARATVSVRNAGSIVDGFRLTVLGAAAPWSEIVISAEAAGKQDSRDVINVYPGTGAVAVLVVSAPAGSGAPTGELPIGVLARSVVDSESSAAAEGVLEVGRVYGLSASLSPVTSRGRWKGRHTVMIRNWGNAAARLRLIASDPDQRLGFLVHPQHLDVPVGGSATAAVRVRSRRPFLRGTPVRLPFSVVGEPEPPLPAKAGPTLPGDPRRPVLDGALDQRPILSRGIVVLATVAIVALAAIAVTAARYTPKPTAEPAVDQAIAEPTSFTAQPVDASTIKLNWAAVDRPPDSYLLFHLDPAARTQVPPVITKQQEVPGSVATLDVTDLPAAAEQCFQLVAVRGEARSPGSEVACATTPAAAPVAAPGPTSITEAQPSGSATPTAPSGAPPGPPPAASLDPDEWLIIVGLAIKTDGNPQILLDQQRQKLVARGLTVGQLDSDDYPQLGLSGSLVLYVGQFETEGDAIERCRADRLELPGGGCDVRRPGPHR